MSWLRREVSSIHSEGYAVAFGKILVGVIAGLVSLVIVLEIVHALGINPEYVGIAVLVALAIAQFSRFALSFVLNHAPESLVIWVLTFGVAALAWWLASIETIVFILLCVAIERLLLADLRIYIRQHRERAQKQREQEQRHRMYFP
jgi:hypothetical protein